MEDRDVILIGSGIMSGTLGVMLKQLDPALTIQAFVQRCMAARAKTDHWKQTLAKLVPSYGRSLADDPALTKKLRAWTDSALGLSVR